MPRQPRSGISELLGVVVTLLGEVGARIERLAKLDPIAEPVFRRETADAIRSRLGATHDVEVMRALAHDLYKGVEALDVQITRAEKR